MDEDEELDDLPVDDDELMLGTVNTHGPMGLWKVVPDGLMELM